MLRCHLECTYSDIDKGHFHCPFCNGTRSRKDNIASHAAACYQERQVMGRVSAGDDRSEELMETEENTGTTGKSSKPLTLSFRLLNLATK